MKNLTAVRKFVNRFLVCTVALTGLLSCTMKAQMDDISAADLSFLEPSGLTFTNNTGYNFKMQISSTNKDITAEKAVLQIYEGPGCDPDKLISTTSLNAAGSTAQASSTSALQDGKYYSARVMVDNKDRHFQSVCSSTVGVDTQTPNPVGLTYPTGNGFNSSKELMAAWTPATDNGIAGLSVVPYRLRLFGLASCAGPVVQKVDSPVEQYKFKRLTQGIIYSVQVSSVDKAGNESVLACSPYTEIDVNVPGFTLRDSTSIDGYSRVNSPQVQIANDSQAAYWCFTPNMSFTPTTYTDACPSGTGSLGGWYTSRPSTLPIGTGDGLKSFNLWIVRGDGTLISLNHSSAAITLDQTPPGSFAVSGVGGMTDTVFDAWLTNSGQPEVKWTASSDAVDYTVDIRTTSNALICSQAGVTGTDYVFTNCPVLTNGQTYRVRITSFDIARNFTLAPDFDFTVDRDPPGNFTISGITGSGDTNIDAFTGAGNPTVNYGSASGSSHYRIQIKDTSGVTVCSLGTKANQSGIFNYATESGVTCAGLMHGGTYRTYVSAYDDGENETQASNNGFAFQVDTVVPTLTLDTVPASLTSNTFANFAFTTTDALSGTDYSQCKLDSGSYANCTTPKNYTGLSEGSHTVNIRTFDKAGNSTLQTYTWIIDLTNPILTIDSQPPAYTPVATNAISFHATDTNGIASITCKVDGGSANACTSPFSTTLAQGAHTVVIRATDNVGFYDEKTVNFIVDTTNPALTLTSIPANPSHSVSSGTVAFTMSDSNLVVSTCQIDGAAYAACSSPATFSGLSAGSHTVNVKATDAAGNFTIQTTTWIIYAYSWATSGFAGCTAVQPNWNTGAFGACSVGQPSYTYSGWGGCSATCGGGWQYQTATCNQVNGSQTRTVSCPTASGTESRSVTCKRNDNVTVSDTYCDAPSKPATTQACSRGGGTDCNGPQPSTVGACSRGGGSDCYASQATAQQCNTQACCTGTMAGGYCWHTVPTGQSCNGFCGSYGGMAANYSTWMWSSASNCQTAVTAVGMGGSYQDWVTGGPLGCYGSTTQGGYGMRSNQYGDMSYTNNGGRGGIAYPCACNQ